MKKRRKRVSKAEKWSNKKQKLDREMTRPETDRMREWKSSTLRSQIARGLELAFMKDLEGMNLD